jgi:Spy/CpxP family protein refolding chaperone
MRRLRFAVAALALGLATSAQSQVAGPPAWLRELDLSEAQQEQVFQIFYRLTLVVRERLQASRHAHEELEDLAIAVSLDSDRGREAFEAEAQALADVAEIRMHAMHSVYELLTVEQRARAVNLPMRYE